MSAFGLSNDKDRQIELARLYETLALSRDLIARSRMLIGELENVRVQSWKAIEESHILLDKAKRITSLVLPSRVLITATGLQLSPGYPSSLLLNGILGLVNSLFGDIEGVCFRFGVGVKPVGELRCFRDAG